MEKIILYSFIPICLLFFAIISFVEIHELRKLTKLIQTKLPHVYDDVNETFDKRDLTSYELERLEREEEFDKRINRLKSELSEQQNILRRGITAEELHPLVHNLPHDTVQTKYDVLPDVEVAE